MWASEEEGATRKLSLTHPSTSTRNLLSPDKIIHCRQLEVESGRRGVLLGGPENLLLGDDKAVSIENPKRKTPGCGLILG
jgi:hypothetical protein